MAKQKVALSSLTGLSTQLTKLVKDQAKFSRFIPNLESTYTLVNESERVLENGEKIYDVIISDENGIESTVTLGTLTQLAYDITDEIFVTVNTAELIMQALTKGTFKFEKFEISNHELGALGRKVNPEEKFEGMTYTSYKHEQPVTYKIVKRDFYKISLV